MKLQSVRGFRDIFPPDISKFQRIESVARETFEKFGFEKLETAYLEYEEVFSKSLGADSDIVHKEMFIFTDSKGRKIALRPEGTASVVRAYLEQGFHVKGGEQRFYYIGPMFRHERPQKGRFRQFYQAGIEILGNAGPRVDAETCFILWQIAEKLKIKGLSLEVNSIGDENCRAKYRDALVSYFKPKEYLLCDDCKNRLATNPLRILDCKNESCRALAQKSPVILDYLCESCREHYAGFKKYLGLFQVPFVENPRIVRGLDYYTRTAFELVSKETSYLGELAGGGRYDGLVEVMGGPKTPAVGFALGIDRVAEYLKGSAAGRHLLIYFIPLGEKAEKYWIRFLKNLDKAKKILLDDLKEDINGLRQILTSTVLDSLPVPDKIWNALKRKWRPLYLGDPNKKVGEQLSKANKVNADYALIMGDDEMESKSIIIRDMKEGAQFRASCYNLFEYLDKNIPNT